jgi:predicted DNA binding CopG/RHH family protein
VDVMENVSNVIKKLSWGTPEDEKEEAMKKLQYIRDEDLHLLLQPISKEYNIGMERLKQSYV